MTARVGIAFGAGLQPPEVVECVRAAEALGYESAWIAEGHGGDQFALLAACAQVTSRIGLATGISSVFVRSAPTLAMAAATVDALSRGRLVLGLGSSHRVQVEPEHGIPFLHPTRRLRETVAVVRALLHDGAVTFHGQVIGIERFDLWFRPFRPAVPLYLAALFPPLLEVCGEIADGALLTWPTLRAGRQAREAIARGARRAGRSPEAVDVAALVPCAVAASVAEARDRLRPVIAAYAGGFPRYRRLFAEAGFAEPVARIHAAWIQGMSRQSASAVPDALVDEVALASTPERCAPRLDAYRRSGIALPIVSPRVGGARALEAALEVIRACAP